MNSIPRSDANFGINANEHTDVSSDFRPLIRTFSACLPSVAVVKLKILILCRALSFHTHPAISDETDDSLACDNQME